EDSAVEVGRNGVGPRAVAAVPRPVVTERRLEVIEQGHERPPVRAIAFAPYSTSRRPSHHRSSSLPVRPLPGCPLLALCGTAALGLAIWPPGPSVRIKPQQRNALRRASHLDTFIQSGQVARCPARRNDSA